MLRLYIVPRHVSVITSCIFWVLTTQMLTVSCFVAVSRISTDLSVTVVTYIVQFFVGLSTRTAFRDSLYDLIFYKLCQVASALHFLALSDKFISYCTVNFMVNFLLLRVEFYSECFLVLFYCLFCIACCMQSGRVCAC